MTRRATILLSRDPERSLWERMGLRLAGFRATELAVKPMYYLRTGVWLNDREANALVAISRMGTRPILFISGGLDEICPPENAILMYDEARSPAKQLLVIPNAEHDATFQEAPRLYESTVVAFLRKALRQ
jgi:fermentation-respiration switch protein FrsA (DUF1100 family)